MAGVGSNTVEFQISAAQAGMIDLSQIYILSRITMKQTTTFVAVPREGGHCRRCYARDP